MSATSERQGRELVVTSTDCGGGLTSIVVTQRELWPWARTRGVLQLIVGSNIVSLSLYGRRSASISLSPVELRALVRVLEEIPPHLLEEREA